MNPAVFSIKNNVITWMVIILMTIGGIISFLGLGQLEQPEFTIKQALVITAYPGASPEQVEEEVSLPLEDAIQQMQQVKLVKSINSAGLSQIEVEVKSQYGKDRLPQVWNELRNKVSDTLGQLPSGVAQPIIVDDFSDVFGYLMNLNGEGYSYQELEKFSDLIRRELVLVDGVKKVSVEGMPEQQVVVEISQAKLAALGLDPNYIYQQLQNQNVVSNAGKMLIGSSRVRITPTGEFSQVSEMENLIINAPNGNALVYLGDIATIYKTTSEEPKNIYHDKGQRALSIGVSFNSGVNVVDVSNAITQEMEQLLAKRPIGMEINTVYNQGAIVEKTVNGFLLNLAESIAIVIVVLLIFMGLKAGVLMGGVLLITILGTFIVMNVLGIQLQSISLGALIIALGMLVDNAIVVTEGIIIGIKRGHSRLHAAKTIVTQTQWPLFGATVIGILAFAPIGLSPDDTGEFCGSLFKVLLISLSISWFTAMTITPFFCHLLFKDGEALAAAEDTYQGFIFNAYRSLLNVAMRFRKSTMLLVLSFLIAAIVGMGFVKQVFFPPSNTPIFMIDVWLEEGSDIRFTDEFIRRIENDIIGQDIKENIGLKNITTVIGQGAQRFILPYQPEKGYSSYGQMIIEMASLDQMNAYLPTISRYLRSKYPEAEYKVKLIENGPSPAAKIEARFYGEDPVVLRKLAAQAEDIFHAEPSAENIRHNWRNQTLIVRPQFNLAQAREAGISKQSLDSALLMNFNGQTIGTYREQSDLMPIVARAPQEERLDAGSISQLQVWSSENNTFVPVAQVVSSFENEWENPIIMRRDRKRVISVFADPVLTSDETADSVLAKVRAKVEALELPEGYELEWGGEYETSSDAQQSLGNYLPLGFLSMFLITVALFNSVKQAFVIWVNVPLALIGLVLGLLTLNAPFSFMAILGMLSLSGMIVKNGIVLVDQINLELEEGKSPYQAVYDSSVSRVRPVCMAALTTMLGLIPLLSDPFFMSMAVTIVFGLGVATLLTLIVLPVAYTLIFKIPVPKT
ncbi:efflux RND transporter permease subunit [Vibrio aestuarianus subsp. cardii]|uniref:efflux RND transporter permease subunit n=1 Tax=Vibrio aestuarianus TaxID=28171 RepID=UPI001559ACC3|nr:efflux RND transporter permease subunit [Vibrio aestuarianus]NGZ68996.1 efflux RND transporter permease subunit [Vibrio aestuarianus subsp. cardii]